jgi:hypothetical protein
VGIPASIRDVLGKPGRPLDEPTRSWMERGFDRVPGPGAAADPERQADHVAERVVSANAPAPPRSAAAGHDFSQMRVHTDERAAASAEDVNALAYTVGQRSVFAAGRYAPETTAGRRLLAHELAHVVQQQTAPPGVAPTVQRQENNLARRNRRPASR